MSKKGLYEEGDSDLITFNNMREVHRPLNTDQVREVWLKAEYVCKQCGKPVMAYYAPEECEEHE